MLIFFVLGCCYGVSVIVAIIAIIVAAVDVIAIVVPCVLGAALVV